MAASAPVTKDEKLDAIVRRSQPSGNQAFGQKQSKQMPPDQFDKALDEVRERFGITLDSRLTPQSRFRPSVSQTDLMALCKAVEDGRTFQARTRAVGRLQRLGFRVGFTADGPRPQNVGSDGKSPIRMAKPEGGFSIVENSGR